MSFCWDNYLQLAKELLNSSKNNVIKEAYLRTSISRLYYGIFCLARNYLINQKNITIPSINTHKFVHDEFNNSQDTNEKLIGQYLLNLWRYRKKADYDDNYPISYNSTKNIHAFTNFALNTIQQLQP